VGGQAKPAVMFGFHHLGSARPEMVIFPNLFVGRKKLRTFISLR
jgi:hypothetical protein